MREILFRGKRVGFNEWIEGYYFQRKNNECVEGFVAAQMSECAAEFKPVYPETVGQYTGLTDKNGKKIFEGDIVSGFFNHEKVVGYIFYGSDASFFIQRDGLFGIGLNNASDWLEVIGNIHDNPKLLEDKP